ncbi:hypothetical protein NSPZN2_11557 [Nitrospira defluvii]|uniref:Uncharacterized protein n=1 Tax=Nitrospira defluvii TaxID=330214 RepID=A0ABM8QVU5_9BACT|nr:hypothetical protein NSPZN2_11557 [Nitrospira defluvii]
MRDTGVEAYRLGRSQTGTGRINEGGPL